ncbi:MAG: branched-chain amino acid ABC transporter permease [Candidatus Dormibacteria bacterium]
MLEPGAAEGSMEGRAPSPAEGPLAATFDRVELDLEPGTVAAGAPEDEEGLRGEPEIPLTATQAEGGEGTGLSWMLASVALVLLIAGWLLPWYVEPTANGVGYSAQDALTQTLSLNIQGVGSLLVVVLGLCLLGLLAGFLNDLSARFLGRGTLFRQSRIRVALALAGALCTLLIAGLMSVPGVPPLFGPIDVNAIADGAVWMTLTGFIVAAFAYGLPGPWLIGIAGTVLGVVSWSQPWYVSTGIGAKLAPSATQQLLNPSSSGAGDILLLVVALGVVAAVAGLAADAVASLRGQAIPVLARLRAIVLFAGAGAALLVLILVSGLHSSSPFGALHFESSPRDPINTYAGDPAWMVVLGLVLAGIAAGFPRLLSRRTVVLAVLAFAIGGVFPAIFNQADDFVAWGARFAVIYVLLALGLNVVVGFAGLLDLGYAAFFAIGAYTTAILSGPRYGLQLPFFLLIFIGAAMAFTFGAILGAPTLRLRGDYLAIVTLGFGEIVPNLATNNIFSATGGPNGDGANPASLLGNNFGPLGALPQNTKFYFWALLALVALVIWLMRNVERSRLGRAWVAIREDEVAAAATGINTVSTKLLAFSIGASVSGFAGAFFGAMLGTVTPDNFQFAVSVTALATVVLGGIGNISGVIVGALLIAFVINWVLPNLGEWTATAGHTIGVSQLSSIDYSQYTYIIFGLILITIMVLRPGGLLPSRARKVELRTTSGSDSLAEVQGRV